MVAVDARGCREETDLPRLDLGDAGRGDPVTVGEAGDAEEGLCTEEQTVEEAGLSSELVSPEGSGLLVRDDAGELGVLRELRWRSFFEIGITRVLPSGLETPKEDDDAAVEKRRRELRFLLVAELGKDCHRLRSLRKSWDDERWRWRFPVVERHEERRRRDDDFVNLLHSL
ncbi:hypothetical protein MLD38_038642 [Melastoma candidum]|uniref:Uncharacterized protein n=1 Tax=Melastoma candidum TaxID=119954 RepID=A0ACB9L087_9MYRT|nr:hypothetical protein MLD38_038642 [Melastoma candidum]